MNWLGFKTFGFAAAIFICFCMPVGISAQDLQIGTDNSTPPTPPTPPASIRFEHYTSDDGLANDRIGRVLQDRKGFLWISTRDGLSRFDGYRFKNYKFDFSDKNSISSNWIKTIYETKSGDLWIGTLDGLNKYRPETDDFESYKFKPGDSDILVNTVVQVIYEAKDGLLWIGTGVAGLASFDRETKTFNRYMSDKSDPETLSGDNIFGIVEDDDGFLWIGTDTGLSKFDRATEKFVRFFHDPLNSNSLSNNTIISLIKDQEGILWIGTREWVNSFDPKKEEFTRYIFNEKGSTSPATNTEVEWIYETKSSEIWVAGGYQQLQFFNKEDGAATATYKHIPSDRQSLLKGNINSIFEDRQNQLWVGTSAGLNKYNRQTSRFTSIEYEANNPKSISNGNATLIVEDQNKILWLAAHAAYGGLFRGLIKYDPKKDEFENFTGDFGTPAYIHRDKKGKIWVCASKRIFHLNSDATRLTEYKVEGNDVNIERIEAMDSDHEGNLWIGTHDGFVSRLNTKTGKITQLNKRVPGTNDRIKDILVDSKGYVWVGSGRVLDRYDRKTLESKRFISDPNDDKSLSAQHIEAIHEDKNGTLWFGTDSGGLNKFDRETETFSHFTENDGLPNNTIHEILEDEKGFLWMSTNRGLSQFNPKSQTFRNYFVSDGLPYDEFNRNSAFKSEDGTMYFGTPKGFIKFYPKDFGENSFEPPIYLTDVRILEKSIAKEKDVSDLTELNLSYLEYIVSFEFAALDLTNTSNIKYQWKLEGFDSEWINGGTRRVATYNNLAGGEYVLKVKATNANGVWGEEKELLKISVTPPFYKTYWFLGLMLFLIGLFIYLAFRYRMNQLQAVVDQKVKYSRKLIETQEAERKRIASELHDGLGQELVIIKNRAELGLQNGGENAATSQFEDISETASIMLDEVRSITNDLRPHLLDKLGLTKSIKAMIRKVSGVIAVESSIDDIDGIFSEGDEINIYRIVQESLNNVVKHSNASDAIVRIKHPESGFSISVEDNGKGFDPETVSDGSFGLIGLRERSNLLGSKLKIDSRQSVGTTIKVVIDI